MPDIQHPFVPPLIIPSVDLQAISAEMEAHGDDAVSKLLPLTHEDRTMIGTVVQAFALCDFHARRGLDIINLFEGKEDASTKRIADKEVFALLEKRSSVLPLSDSERRLLSNAIEIMEQNVSMRHLFAHGAGLRHPIQDALVFLSFNKSEASRKFKHEPDHLKASSMVASMPDIRSRLPSILKNCSYIGHTVAEWYQRFTPDD